MKNRVPRRPRRLAVSALASFGLLFLGTSGPAHALPALPPGFSDQSVVEPIGYSTSVAFTPDGRMLFNETGGLVKVRSASGAVSTVSSGFGAIYSIAVDKDFAANRYIYVLYMTGSPPDR